MFASIFDPEAPFWKMMSLLVDVLALSLLWLFCSLPLFTVGAATTALYDSAARCVRGGANGTFSRFFQTFRREFATSTAVTVAWGALLVVLGLCLRLVWSATLAGSANAAVAVACSLAFLLVPVGAACWMFPLLSRFTFRPAGLMLAGLRFAVGYLPYTVAIVAAGTAAVLASGFLWFPALALPCLTALFWTVMMERAFRKYMPGEGADSAEQEDG